MTLIFKSLVLLLFFNTKFFVVFTSKELRIDFIHPIDLRHGNEVI